ncbi:MAG: hypothetical protein HY815_25370 [Candidatus Riflebacteria bacterium]|nr:hypothetical protein [Candidatus Riflebacteria bacterium]
MKRDRVPDRVQVLTGLRTRSLADPGLGHRDGDADQREDDASNDEHLGGSLSVLVAGERCQDTERAAGEETGDQDGRDGLEEGTNGGTEQVAGAAVTLAGSVLENRYCRQDTIVHGSCWPGRRAILRIS